MCLRYPSHSMHITSSCDRRKPCHLLRGSHGEEGQVKVPTLSELTPLQRRAFELLEAEPHPARAQSGPPAPEVGT